MRNFLITLFIIFSCLTAVHAEIQTQTVDYTAGDTTMKGYLAYDDAIEGKRPGILVVHEWWGHNDYARKRAEMLAGLGYAAFAVDMYGDGKIAAHPDDASKFAAEVKENKENAKARFLAAFDILKNQETTDPDKIAAIGYCFGGSTVLEMARAGVDLKGVVSFHGSLGADTPAEPGAVKAKILVSHGADDSFIPEEQIAAFKAEMEKAGADYQFISYPGAKHSFTNPDADEYAKKFGLGVAYNEIADKKSWQDMQEFLDRIFGQTP